MEIDLIYYRYDIENWLDENDENFDYADTPEEYAENAVRYHNSTNCVNRCQCIDENFDYVSPILSIHDQVWFKEIAAKRIGINWSL